MRKTAQIAVLAAILVVLCVVPVFASVQQQQVYRYVKCRSIGFGQQGILKNEGQISFEGYTYSLPYTALILHGSKVLMEFIPPSGYKFLLWITTGPLKVDNIRENPTYLTVEGKGYVIAVFKQIR